MRGCCWMLVLFCFGINYCWGGDEAVHHDVLAPPYPSGKFGLSWGSNGNKRDVPETEVHMSGGSPSVVVRRKVREGISVHVALAGEPSSTVSVYEPGDVNSCNTNDDPRALVSTTARRFGCIFASNAGYFNTQTGSCYGDIVSDGRIVQAPNRRNAHFGIRQDGTIEVGYLKDIVEQESSTKVPFAQLISGALWLVRNGRNFVSKSIQMEDSSIQETGSWSYFANVKSARTAIGHTSDGRVIIVQHDGKTGSAGVNLYEMADLLIEMDVINAINLDGGGSSVSVVNGTVVSTTSDSCSYNQCGCVGNQSICSDECSNFVCERKVTTIICMHNPRPSNGELKCFSDADCNKGSFCKNADCQHYRRSSYFGLPCRVVAPLFIASLCTVTVLLVCTITHWYKTRGFGSVFKPKSTMDPLMTALSWIPDDEDDEEEDDFHSNIINVDDDHTNSSSMISPIISTSDFFQLQQDQTNAKNSSRNTTKTTHSATITANIATANRNKSAIKEAQL